MQNSRDESTRHTRDRQLIGGVAWTAAARLTSQLVTWAATLIVARLLAPADYGIVAGATVYMGLVAILTEFGLATAVVSQRNLSASAIAQLGGFSLVLGATAWLITILAAPALSDAMRIRELRVILPVLGVGTVLSSINSLPFAMLQKDLRFRDLANIELIRTVVGTSTLLILALNDFGFWALVLNEVVSVAAITIVLRRKVAYRLSLPRFAEIRSSLKISRDVLLARGAWYTYSNADFAVIGRALGKQALGDYSMAWTLTTMPSQKIAGLIMNVTTGVFASVQNEPEELQRYFKRIAQVLAMVQWPATIGLALVAPELVLVLLGPRWTGAIPIIQALALATATRALGPLCSQVLLARLRSTVELRYTALSAIILPIGFLIGSRFGAVGVAMSWSILSLPLVVLQLRLTCREIGLSLRSFLLVLVGPLSGTCVMSASVAIARDPLARFTDSARVGLIALVVVGIVSYGTASLILMPKQVRSLLRVISRTGTLSD